MTGTVMGDPIFSKLINSSKVRSVRQVYKVAAQREELNRKWINEVRDSF